MNDSVDRGLKWQRSTFCADNQCFEVARRGEDVLLRNSDRPGEIIVVTIAEWRIFVAGIVGAGDFRF